MFYFLVFCFVVALLIAGLLIIWNGYDFGDGFIITAGIIISIIAIALLVFHP